MYVKVLSGVCNFWRGREGKHIPAGRGTVGAVGRRWWRRFVAGGTTATARSGCCCYPVSQGNVVHVVWMCRRRCQLIVAALITNAAHMRIT